VLAAWKAGKHHQPGKQHIYTHAGFILLHVALERRFQSSIGDLIDASVLKPLGMADTTLPLGDENGRAQLAPALLERTVQGYSEEGEAIGAPGDVQGYYHWPGTAQMYSSARDMAGFLAANLGKLPIDRALQAAMQDAQHGIFSMSWRVTQGLAWEVDRGPPLINGKNGGLNKHDLLHRDDARREAWYPHSLQSRQRQCRRAHWATDHARAGRVKQRGGKAHRHPQLTRLFRGPHSRQDSLCGSNSNELY
jgi:CubicO group peptidase (beta-lactamase class C family)